MINAISHLQIHKLKGNNVKQKEVVAQFESMFFEMLLKNAKTETTITGEKAPGNDFYQETFLAYLAHKIASTDPLNLNSSILPD